MVQVSREWWGVKDGRRIDCTLSETLAKRSAASSYAGPAATWTLAPAALAAVLVAGVL